ncbi:Crp/Fnr family transcriptional regulator [Burkholderiaceae bacterium FT117]|uniref:Crp/Fnr family transcriptional regulator n=1 Tax=Zeimonas sediminis TaxID=2944268 RepID=UPI002343224E|nr:Crp/Fnr family transcriptional regulator [Zeimonas sediminis]MCM5570148.1 Crp/Fnr family transcriptional regulator [Zeimonas sediminis]
MTEASRTAVCSWPLQHPLADTLLARGAVPGCEPIQVPGGIQTNATGRHPFCLMCDVVDHPDDAPEPGEPGARPGAVRIPLLAGARLFEAGTLGKAIYVVQSGIVKETIPCPDDSVCIVRLVSRGGVVGLSALLGQPHGHSAYVMHPGTACRIPVALVDELREEDPRVTDRLFHDWHQAVVDADRILGEFGKGTARARLARLLLFLRSRLQPGEPLWLRRTDVAALLAITPVSVARLLAEFKREGLLDEEKRRCVGIDEARLREIARNSRG